MAVDRALTLCPILATTVLAWPDVATVLRETLTFAAWHVARTVPSTVLALSARHGRDQLEPVTVRGRSGLGSRACARTRCIVCTTVGASVCLLVLLKLAALVAQCALTRAAMLCPQSYKRHNAEYNGAIEYDSEGKAYGCSVAEYAATPEDCQAGGWGFTLVGIVGIFYSIAVFHTAVFGFLTWMKRIEAPPTSHGLGPKKPDVAVAVRTVF